MIEVNLIKEFINHLLNVIMNSFEGHASHMDFKSRGNKYTTSIAVQIPDGELTLININTRIIW